MFFNGRKRKGTASIFFISVLYLVVMLVMCAMSSISGVSRLNRDYDSLISRDYEEKIGEVYLKSALMDMISDFYREKSKEDFVFYGESSMTEHIMENIYRKSYNDCDGYRIRFSGIRQVPLKKEGDNADLVFYVKLDKEDFVRNRKYICRIYDPYKKLEIEEKRNLNRREISELVSVVKRQ